MDGKRALWGSTLGFLLAAIGSAIGLGNIWRFSYMAYKQGGGAFLIPYIVALIAAGIPLMILEYTLGHREKGSSPLAFARISPSMEWVGWWMPIVALFGIMLYYAVIIGWCINYLFFSLNLSWGADPEAFFFNNFLQLKTTAFAWGGVRIPIVLSTFVVWFICWIIGFREINHGIEKACMVFMPLLFVLTLILTGWTLSLDGAGSAVLREYLNPDWDRINPFVDWSNLGVWSAAFGQIFFTLSLGFGIMITYASYLPRKTDIVGNALWTSCMNCLYSFIAGFAVFGIVGFMAISKGVPFDQAIRGGPSLAFVVYPEAISQLPFGNRLFGVMFFLVLVMAGLSSGISLIEAFTCSIIDKFNWPRKKVITAICAAGFAGSIMFTTRAGLILLDIADHFITHYGLVLGGVLECVLVGWLLKARQARRHVNDAGGVRLSILWDVAVRYITPLILVILIVESLIRELRAPYEGYDIDALLVFGAGWLIVSAAVAVAFTFYPWDPAKLSHKHRPEDEHLLT